jgi:hypothetical protein
MKSSSVIGVVWFVMVLCVVVWQAFHSRSPLYAWLGAGLVVAWGVHSFFTFRRGKREGEALADWHRRLRAAVDVQDFDDDGHLHELFEPAERERLIQELERMPRGSRSLRRAIEIVSPEIANEDA